jgi:hypothetical protein
MSQYRSSKCAVLTCACCAVCRPLPACVLCTWHRTSSSCGLSLRPSKQLCPTQQQNHSLHVQFLHGQYCPQGEAGFDVWSKRTDLLKQNLGRMLTMRLYV